MKSQLLAHAMREQDLQGFVLNAARDMSYRVYHARPGMMRSGRWSSPTQGHIGWPDLAMVRGNRLIITELKSEKGHVTQEQNRWLEALVQVPGVETYIWRPGDWLSGEILRVLKGEP